MTKEEQARKRKQEIVHTALDLFIHKGYYGASTRQISEKAGISVGLMFHYFKDKNDLYCELIKIGTQKMHLQREEEIPSPEEYLYGMVSTLFHELETNRFFAKMFVFMDQAQHTQGIPQQGRELLDANNMIEECTKIIEKGQKEGQFKEGDPKLLGKALLCAIQGVAQEKVRVPEDKLPDPDWIMDMIRK